MIKQFWNRVWPEPSFGQLARQRINSHLLELMEAENALRAAQARVDYHKSVLQYLNGVEESVHD